uniref:Toxin Acra3 n=1 Tax=Androctonus crassicauda TaxID=122909 RepID=TX30_ANDCR|nr:RecName: Full=Toxin Acra3; Flags: Precursor [Androctonus crassicauda]ADK12684.1 Acra-3 toxin [Androctonus crassicauda]
MKIIFLVLMMILSEVYSDRDGYPVHDGTNCKYSCDIREKWEYCTPLCKRRNAKTGYCYAFACWCIGLPDEVKVYGDDGIFCKSG